MPLSALFSASTTGAIRTRARLPRPRWRQLGKALILICISAIVAILSGPAPVMPLGTAGYRTEASGRSGLTTPAQAPLSATRDLAVTGTGDSAGYHLYVASATARWRWRALATIQPAGDDEQRWIGQQCLTGDGRSIVAVIAPWSANNSEAGMDAGAFAYAVSVATGAVRPIAAGVSLAYFDPGCGTGGSIALTSYLGPSQRPTRITVYDATTGRYLRAATVGAEITSAVPADGRILAAEGADLVDVTTGRPVLLHRFGGQLADLIPSAHGGVDLVAQAQAGQLGVWHAGRGVAARLVASGGQASMRLLPGAGGRNLVANAARIAAGSGLRAVSLPGALAPAGASAAGGLLLVTDTAAGAGVTRGPDPNVAVWQPGSPRASRVRLPSAVTDAVLTTPAVSAASPAGNGAYGRARTAATGNAFTPDTGSTYSPDTTVPRCAVPRNDIFKQAWQPGADQVRWAVNQAALNALSATYTAVQRPPDNAIYTVNDADYTPLTTLFPSDTWPLANLVSGASPAVTVPPLVMYGILAQESNWDQASWHAVPGRSGNPLIADYYGTGNPNNPTGALDYNYSDCGYGIAQVTTGMQNLAYPNPDPGVAPPLPAATQVALAVDYAANIAYGESILQGKWDQLKSLGIVLNNGDPTKIENWYAAIWAYNSGVYTGGPGLQGLGWFNNPANPIYPFNRHTFLHVGTALTPGDAATPQYWPYQEKVFGWMEVPLAPGGVLDYRGTYDWDSGTGTFLQLPSEAAFCSTAVNNCDPTVLGSSDPCPAENSSCWWSAPVRTVYDDCASSCTTDTVTDAPNNHEYFDTPGLPEPGDPPQSATCGLGANTPVTTSSGSLIPGAVLVDDQMITAQNPHDLTPNLMGCSSANSALVPPASANASFSLLGPGDVPIDASASPGQDSAIDLHQLGGGVGGHIFFTHTGGSQSAEARGRWQATLPASTATGTAYQIYAFIPDIGSATGHATYEINTGSYVGTENNRTANPAGQAIATRTINQGNYNNQWVSLGYYLCGGGAGGTGSGPASCTMNVTLRSATPSGDSTQGADIAFNAVAFVPAPTGGYVALGDSYSSGEGAFYPNDPSVPDGYDDGTDVSANAPGEYGDNGDLCHRSSMSWPRLLAAAKGLPIVELACSGSNLGDLVPGDTYSLDQQVVGQSFLGLPFYKLDILNDGSVSAAAVTPSGWVADVPNNEHGGSAFYGEPTYQLELLRALQPKLVTVTTGGNDVGFADILGTCVSDGPCKPLFSNGSGPDKIDKRIASLQPLLAAAYTAIKTAAGTGNVYAVTYPAPIEADGSGNDCTYIEPGDRAWLASKMPVMATAIINAAKQAGIEYVDISTLFNGHGPCAGTNNSNVPYVNAPDFRPNQCGTAACMDTWFHPNKFGYQVMEAAIAAKVTF